MLEVYARVAVSEYSCRETSGERDAEGRSQQSSEVAGSLLLALCTAPPFLRKPGPEVRPVIDVAAHSELPDLNPQLKW
jgi:hypothetical protein